MGVIQRISDAVRGNSSKKSIVQETGGQIYVNPICSAYENFFAQVRPLIDEMEAVFPYGIGRSGNKLSLQRTPELAVLLSPNEDMGWVDFADAMFAAWLTLSELNIHVWKDRRGNVSGYTILPPNARHTEASGIDVFRFYSTEFGYTTLEKSEVMTLRFSRNPINLDSGVSPASSAFIWSQIDDLMAQYQKAFFENGAVPATITMIRASSKERYEKARAELERGTKGAKNSNKTVYVWRMFDTDTNTDRDQIEIKTIQGPNSTLAIKDLAAIITDRLNKAVGVSEFILGNDSNAKYDNAELSDLLFTKRRVAPALRRFWSQFQHELDRVTGGLGYAISYDLDIPELTDRKKTLAEVSEKNVSNLESLISAGSRPLPAVQALGLGDEWKAVANGIYNRVLSEQNESVANSTVADLQKQKFIEGQRATEATSTFDKNAPNSTQRINSENGSERTTDTYTTVWGADEPDAKAIYDQLMEIAQAIADQNPDIPLEQIEQIILDILTRQADQGANAGAAKIAALAYGNSITEEDAEALRNEINTTLEDDGFHVSEDVINNLQERVDTLVKSFSQETREIVAETLNTANEEALSAAEIKKRLSEVMPRARAATIARNETVNAFRQGRIGNDEYLSQKYGVKLAKIWRCNHDERTCPVCEAMDGEITGLREAFPDEVTKDGETFSFDHSVWNMNGESPNAHVNCRCYFDEVVVDD